VRAASGAGLGNFFIFIRIFLDVRKEKREGMTEKVLGLGIKTTQQHTHESQKAEGFRLHLILQQHPIDWM